MRSRSFFRKKLLILIFFVALFGGISYLDELYSWIPPEYRVIIFNKSSDIVKIEEMVVEVEKKFENGCAYNISPEKLISKNWEQECEIAKKNIYYHEKCRPFTNNSF